ncbi:MAG: formate--tetrahydrofolate ligase [Intestinimonas sp.]
MKSDIEIAQAAEMLPISRIAARWDLARRCWNTTVSTRPRWIPWPMRDRPRKGRLILVTAISPTPAGEGKTTTSVGLADALTLLGKKTVLALREPSLGPVFGVKGGAAGGS